MTDGARGAGRAGVCAAAGLAPRRSGISGTTRFTAYVGSGAEERRMILRARGRGFAPRPAVAVLSVPPRLLRETAVGGHRPSLDFAPALPDYGAQRFTPLSAPTSPPQVTNFSQ